VNSVKETVRFQYDGKLKMDVTLKQTDDNKTCQNNTSTDLTDPTIGKSFHVIDYMKIYKMRIDLFYEIIPGVAICDMLDAETHQVEIINNVGLDILSGFDAFYTQLDDEVKNALAVCSSIAPNKDTPAQGACLKSVKHNDQGREAGLDFHFAAGRPYPFGPTYTKNINYKVIGGVSSAQHFAEFFVEGLFSKGNGNSFALPTHEPIMVLRDPPGGDSTATYSNVKTRMTMYTYSDTIEAGGTLALSTGLAVGTDVDTCVGGGFGAMVLACLPTADAKADVELSMNFGMGTLLRCRASSKFGTIQRERIAGKRGMEIEN
jgi:hypothetical protein